MEKKMFAWAVLGVLVIAGLIMMTPAKADPGGPSIIWVGESTTSATNPTADTNTSHTGGKIITAIINATQQTTHWKAYVGNVTGKLTLDDANNYTIYDWDINTVGGEVYATRSSSVTWANVECANSTVVQQEMTEMNHNSTYAPNDMINMTFDDDANNHDGFYAGSVDIAANSCNYSIQTYVNDAPQSGTEYFEEVLLYEPSAANLIYTEILEDSQTGYNNQPYDFQMLVAENAKPGQAATEYYFYVELL